ncbi:hypothetical protein Zm00014a_027102 [Zea mays]|uniref:Uncharacterized protein n=1 Tax=Zea mays TaxID=4577 RepID=A0A3L6EX71_MAIZE|nr:hypothetical protein Zm00014a_027102 [Zea mays]
MWISPQLKPVAALESREVIAVEALKQAKDEHVQKLMEAYLVTHNQRRALRIQEPAPSNPVQPIRAEDPRFLKVTRSLSEEKEGLGTPGRSHSLGRNSSLPKAMDKQEHPESSQDPPPELFEPLTMKKIPAPSLEVKEEAASTPPAPPPSEELQEPVRLKKSSTRLAISVAARRSHQHQLPLDPSRRCLRLKLCASLARREAAWSEVSMPSPLHALGSEVFLHFG